MKYLLRYNYGRTANQMITVLNAMSLALHCRTPIRINSFPFLQGKVNNSVVFNDPPFIGPSAKAPLNCPCDNNETSSAFYWSIPKICRKPPNRKQLAKMANEFRGITSQSAFGERCTPTNKIYIYFRAGDVTGGMIVNNNTWKTPPVNRWYGQPTLSSYVRCLRRITELSNSTHVRLLYEDQSNPVIKPFSSIAKIMGYTIEDYKVSYYDTIHSLACAQYMCVTKRSFIKSLFINTFHNKYVIKLPQHHRIWNNTMTQRIELLQD